MLVVDGRAATCLDQVLVAATADHGERHAPDVAGRRRVRRVEVAVGIEPGDRERLTRPGLMETGHRPRVGRAVTAQEDQASVGVAADGRMDGIRSRGRNSAMRPAFFARGSGSGTKPGSILRSPAS